MARQILGITGIGGHFMDIAAFPDTEGQFEQRRRHLDPAVGNIESARNIAHRLPRTRERAHHEAIDPRIAEMLLERPRHPLRLFMSGKVERNVDLPLDAR